MGGPKKEEREPLSVIRRHDETATCVGVSVLRGDRLIGEFDRDEAEWLGVVLSSLDAIRLSCECGAVYAFDHGPPEDWIYCPDCGRKVRESSVVLRLEDVPFPREDEEDDEGD